MDDNDINLVERIIQRKINELIASNKGEYEELKIVLHPARLKHEIREVMKTILENELKKLIIQETQRFFNENIYESIKIRTENVIDETVKNNINIESIKESLLNDVVAKKIIRDGLREALKNHNKNVIKEIRDYIYTTVSLRTSSLEIVSQAVNQTLNDDEWLEQTYIERKNKTQETFLLENTGGETNGRTD